MRPKHTELVQGLQCCVPGELGCRGYKDSRLDGGLKKLYMEGLMEARPERGNINYENESDYMKGFSL